MTSLHVDPGIVPRASQAQAETIIVVTLNKEAGVEDTAEVCKCMLTETLSVVGVSIETVGTSIAELASRVGSASVATTSQAVARVLVCVSITIARFAELSNYHRIAEETRRTPKNIVQNCKEYYISDRVAK